MKKVTNMVAISEICPSYLIFGKPIRFYDQMYA